MILTIKTFQTDTLSTPYYLGRILDVKSGFRNIVVLLGIARVSHSIYTIGVEVLICLVPELMLCTFIC